MLVVALSQVELLRVCFSTQDFLACLISYFPLEPKNLNPVMLSSAKHPEAFEVMLLDASRCSA